VPGAVRYGSVCPPWQRNTSFLSCLLYDLVLAAPCPSIGKCSSCSATCSISPWRTAAFCVFACRLPGGLTGPSGAGKSTVICMLTSGLRPSQGHALLGGGSSDGCGTESLGSVGLCQQSDVALEAFPVTGTEQPRV
jgi:hypothetical protein